MRMKRTNFIFKLCTTLTAVVILASANVLAQKTEQADDNSTAGSFQILINEIEADPGNQQNDSCQYIELRGAPNSTVPSNVYFVAIDSDQAFTGRLHHVVPIGGVSFGSNGLIYLNNTVAPVCPNRTAAAGTTVVNYSSVIRIGGGNLEVNSESFAVIQTTANIFAGLDIDTQDDGVLDIAITEVYDAIAFRIDPDQQWVYPDTAPVLGTAFTDVPDALVRFPGNNTPFSADAYYYGEIATTPDESTTFVAPLSANFPVGGMLTPGAPNVPATSVPTPARADFDADGKTDLAVFRGSEGNWYINRSTQGFFVLNWGIASDQLVPADFDGDGKTDTAIFRPTEDSNQPDFYILNSNGFVVSGASWGVSGDVSVAGDYDGDGKADIAVYRQSNTTWYILRSGGGTTFTSFGTGTDEPVPGDYDGDGKTDIAVYSNGTWNAQLSGGGTMSIALGQAGDKLVAGDYDGDGTTDVAVYRPSNGTWYAIHSSNDQLVAVTFGNSTDIPVPGDYDGDGKEDQAVYRNGTWWILGSAAGLSVQQFGVTTDVAVPSKARP